MVMSIVFILARIHRNFFVGNLNLQFEVTFHQTLFMAY